MFFIEKIISLTLLSPLPIIVILIIIGFGNIFNRRKKLGALLILMGVFLYLASTDVFIDKRLYNLENSYSVISDEELEKSEAYILLGGGIITRTGAGNIPALNATARIMKVAEYYRKIPKKIYISGGTPLQDQESESSVYAKELVALGVNFEDIVMEEESRNTNENALFIAKELRDKGIKKIALVTSASHMKRSMLVFKKNLQGVDIIPAPCNFLASCEKDNNFYYIPKYYNFMKFQIWIWESIGNLYYKMRY